MLHRDRYRMSMLVTQVIAAAVLLWSVASADAQQPAYPAKAVRLIVAYPPGGTSDIVGRALAQMMGARLGQSFVVENRTGAGGQIGTDAVAKAAPDGYTILVAASGPSRTCPPCRRSYPTTCARTSRPSETS